jgi:hypothetical protein
MSGCGDDCELTHAELEPEQSRWIPYIDLKYVKFIMNGVDTVLIQPHVSKFNGSVGGDMDNCSNDVHSFETKSFFMNFNSNRMSIGVTAVDEYNSYFAKPVEFFIHNNIFNPLPIIPAQKIINGITYHDCYEFVLDSNSIYGGEIRRAVFNKTHGFIEVNCKGGPDFTIL